MEKDLIFISDSYLQLVEEGFISEFNIFDILSLGEKRDPTKSAKSRLLRALVGSIVGAGAGFVGGELIGRKSVEETKKQIDELKEQLKNETSKVKKDEIEFQIKYLTDKLDDVMKRVRIKSSAAGAGLGFLGGLFTPNIPLKLKTKKMWTSPESEDAKKQLVSAIGEENTKKSFHIYTWAKSKGATDEEAINVTLDANKSGFAKMIERFAADAVKTFKAF